MQRTATRTHTHVSRNYQNLNYVSNRKATTSVVKLQKQAKPLAADDTGIHTHAVKEVCEQTNCENKKCITLCNTLKRLDIKGHFTHRPVSGKFCRFISNKDAKNLDQAQYYIKNADKSKQVDAATAQNYYQNGDIKPNANMQNYLKLNNLEDKIND